MEKKTIAAPYEIGRDCIERVSVAREGMRVRDGRATSPAERQRPASRKRCTKSFSSRWTVRRSGRCKPVLRRIMKATKGLRGLGATTVILF